MVSKNQLKLIKSLQQKKYRNQHGLFIVEGLKSVKELLDSGLEVFKIYTTATYIDALSEFGAELISESDLKKVSALHTPSGVLGIFHIPKPKPIDFKDWAVALDDVRDPGNLGTIIRLCDWFGIHHLICSRKTVDCYNPKVLQATMGSISRVNIVYANLPVFLKNTGLPIYGAFMDGQNVYREVLPKAGIIVLGNEANGISDEVSGLLKQRVAIPQYGSKTTESLNVAMATGILLNEIRRFG